MAFTFYGSFTGQKQGSFKGQSPQGRDPKWLHLFHWELGPPAPPDPKTPGKRSGGTIVVTREVDAASPKFFQALNTRETILSAIIEQHEESATGPSRLKRRITLTNGVIRSIRPRVGASRGGLERSVSGRLEVLTLSGETVREERF